MSRLRPFQTVLKRDIYAAWAAGHKNVLGVLPTGGGKTVIEADIVSGNTNASAVVAHRGELVSQISLALARENVRHRIIGPDSLRRDCVSIHMAELGRSLHDPGGRVAVCGIDSLVKKDTSNDSWFRAVSLWLLDEAHHAQKTNKWGKLPGLFVNAWGLGMTATAIRADGGGLGADSDGLFHELVEGPGGRDLINAGYLTDYRIFAPPSDVDYSDVTVTASGDLSNAKLRAAVHASDAFVGDVVKHYLRIAPGKLGITFAVDVESANEIARAFRAAGVPAEVVSAKTPSLLRAQILRRFRNRELLQLVNVDLFGEGFDLPAIEVVSMARKTESFSLYCQQFGRALRLMVAPELLAKWGDFTDAQRLAHIAASTKPHALIIDHVGNVIRHGVPDARRVWTLAPRSSRSSASSDAIPLRACINPNDRGTGIPCVRTYERYLKCCPYCGFYPEPTARTAPSFVDGDLFELDAATLQAMRGEVATVDAAPVIPYHLRNTPAEGNLRNMHKLRQMAQAELRKTIDLWGGWQRAMGRNESESYRIFYFRYGITTLEACALGRPEAEELTIRINLDLQKNGVTAK